jgi:hypothetical protein
MEIPKGVLVAEVESDGADRFFHRRGKLVRCFLNLVPADRELVEDMDIFGVVLVGIRPQTDGPPQASVHPNGASFIEEVGGAGSWV